MITAADSVLFYLQFDLMVMVKLSCIYAKKDRKVLWKSGLIRVISWLFKLMKCDI